MEQTYRAHELRNRWVIKVLVHLMTVLTCVPGVAFGQWLRYPTADVPRTAHGKPNLLAPAPRLPNGKPDFWPWDPPCTPRARRTARCSWNAARNCPARRSWSTWAGIPTRSAVPGVGCGARQAANGRLQQRGPACKRRLPDNPPRLYALPHLTKALHICACSVLLFYQVNAMYRQIFTDARPMPADRNPTWNGYSTGEWEGDTLVVHTIGFRDGLWLDTSGSPMTDAAKMTERFRRPNYGRLEIEVTVDDPKAYTRPWTVSMPMELAGRYRAGGRVLSREREVVAADAGKQIARTVSTSQPARRSRSTLVVVKPSSQPRTSNSFPAGRPAGQDPSAAAGRWRRAAP